MKSYKQLILRFSSILSSSSKAERFDMSSIRGKDNMFALSMFDSEHGLG